MVQRQGSLTAWVAGFLAVLISYAGPLVIFVQAAHAGQVPQAQLVSWVWGISMGAGVSGLLLSGWFRLPIITAWSAPGTALLPHQGPQLSCLVDHGRHVCVSNSICASLLPLPTSLNA